MGVLAQVAAPGEGNGFVSALSFSSVIHKAHTRARAGKGDGPPRKRLFGPERLLDAEDVAERGQAGFEVELGALGQVGRLAVEVEGEERRAALDGRLDHRRRRHLEHLLVGKGGPEGREEESSDLHHGRGRLATEEKVPVVGCVVGGGVLQVWLREKGGGGGGRSNALVKLLPSPASRTTRRKSSAAERKQRID